MLFRSELIKSIMTLWGGSIGIIRPTFEEYPNRYKGKQVVFTPPNADFSYTADDIINFYGKKDISVLILINPDNPSGNYIPKKDVHKLAEWTASKKIKFILDESFVDFADGDDQSLIEQSFLDQHKNVMVVKSISKSYGVPGLRLGVLASGDEELIDFIKKDVGIWNINSFAEFYLQIAEKYSKDYKSALTQFKAERKRFVEKLGKISPNLRPVSTQANYVMIELMGKSATELTEELLLRDDILIKDLSGKIKSDRQYIRVAVRNEADNDRLITALQRIYGGN